MANNPLALIKKISGKIPSSRTRVEISDKLAKVIFKLNDEDNGDLLNGETYQIIEKRSCRN